MKKLALIVGITLTAAATFAQGTVIFGNVSFEIGDNTRLNHWTDVYQGISTQQAPVSTVRLVAGDLVASNLFPSLRAQLYWGARTATSISQLTAITGPPAPFRSTTSAYVGSWNGGSRTVDQWGDQEYVQLAVIIWDLNQALDGFAALQGVMNYSYDGLFGQSALFLYEANSHLDCPVCESMYSLQPFDVAYYRAIPEPPTYALAGPGAAAFLIYLRRFRVLLLHRRIVVFLETDGSAS